MKKTLTIVAWVAVTLLCLSAAAMVVVSIVDVVSRNDAEWMDSGGRHVVELPSAKPSEGD